MITIKSTSGRILYVAERATDVRSALEEAARCGADLSGSSLVGAYFRGADLSGADLSGSNLRDVDLRDVDLRDVDLRGADLRGSDLSVSNLSDANLVGADLRGACLRGADLSGSNLRDACLSDANLVGAYFRGACLRGADLSGSNLRDACLSDADLDYVVAARLSILPEGSLIGWKKAADGRVVKLRIPAGAKRSNATGRKCRADRAKVLAIYAGDLEVSEAKSWYDPDFIYQVGDTIKPRLPFDDNRWRECGSGIHFFITREEAEEYLLG